MKYGFPLPLLFQGIIWWFFLFVVYHKYLLFIFFNTCRYITANAERLRDKFVSHEGKKELSVTASGTLATADYGYLISKISDQIDANTKGNFWIQKDKFDYFLITAIY